MKKSEIILVTGGSGAVGINCILQLLQKGYKVRTTLRNLSKKSGVIDMLQSSGASVENLSFVEADLSSSLNWETAVSGCTYVLHVASPTHIADIKCCSLYVSFRCPVIDN